MVGLESRADHVHLPGVGASWASVCAGGVAGVVLETWAEKGPGMHACILVP